MNQIGKFAAPGSFASFQQALSNDWMRSVSAIKKPKKATQEELAHSRKLKACLDCFKRGFKVKADYSTRKETWNYSTYEVEIYTCPACGKEEKVYSKIKGKGTSGKDSF